MKAGIVFIGSAAVALALAVYMLIEIRGASRTARSEATRMREAEPSPAPPRASSFGAVPAEPSLSPSLPVKPGIVIPPWEASRENTVALPPGYEPAFAMKPPPPDRDAPLPPPPVAVATPHAP